MVLGRILEDWRDRQKGAAAQIEISQVLWHIEACRASGFELRLVGRSVERRWSRKMTAGAAAVDTERSWAREMIAKAVEGTIEGVESLVSPDRVAVGRIALGDRKSRASSAGGGSRAHPAERRCETRWVGCLGVLKFNQHFCPLRKTPRLIYVGNSLLIHQTGEEDRTWLFQEPTQTRRYSNVKSAVATMKELLGLLNYRKDYERKKQQEIRREAIS